MGLKVSKELETRNLEAKNEASILISLLSNKRDALLKRKKKPRGEESSTKNRTADLRENATFPHNSANNGGRGGVGLQATVMRLSEIRIVSQEDDVTNYGLKDTISDFLSAAQGGSPAKAAAVRGLEKVLSNSWFDALFNVSDGACEMKEGFVILFMNFSFVRVDFCIYTYALEGAKWGVEPFQSGSCYIAEISVLDPAIGMKPEEVDKLLSQALYAPSPSSQSWYANSGKEKEAIDNMKVLLVENLDVYRQLVEEDITLEDLHMAIIKLKQNMKLLDISDRQLEDYAFESPTIHPDGKPFSPKPLLWKERSALNKYEKNLSGMMKKMLTGGEIRTRRPILNKVEQSVNKPDTKVTNRPILTKIAHFANKAEAKIPTWHQRTTNRSEPEEQENQY